MEGSGALSKTPHCTSPQFSPLDAWQVIKIHLRDKLGEREWELWIRHARLMKASPPRYQWAAGMFITMPRKGRVIFGALRFYKALKTTAGRLGYDLLLGVAEDLEEGRLFQEYVQTLEDEDPRKRNLLDQVDRNAELNTYIEAPPSELWSEVHPG